MFKLNRLTDYAVVVLSQMSRSPEEVCTAPRISQYTGVPLPTVAKLLNSLAHAGLISSHRGATGGYTLNRNAAEITVAEIIQVMEGPIALTACVDGSESICDMESLCPMRGNWNKVNKAIHGALSEVTLADMAVTFVPFGPPLEASQPAEVEG
ncbi:MAG: SUF system Fe-S cluster assembly regulator [Kiloniellales bacterium]